MTFSHRTGPGAVAGAQVGPNVFCPSKSEHRPMGQSYDRSRDKHTVLEYSGHEEFESTCILNGS